MIKEQIRVQGMTCTACASAIEREVGKLHGIVDVSVNFASEKMQIHYDEGQVSSNDIEAAVSAAGYKLIKNNDQIEGEMPHPSLFEEEMQEMKKRLLLSLLFTLPVFYLAMGPMIGLPLPKFFSGQQNILLLAITELLLTIPVILLGAKFYTVGFRTLLKGHPNMDSLIAVGTTAAFGYGIFVVYQLAYGMSYSDMERIHHYQHDLYFESAAVILTLITLGKFLEARAKGKTSEAIQQLIQLAPDKCLVERNGEVIEILTRLVQTKERVVIKAGSKVPVDGKIIEGYCAVDESMLTGESLPVERSVDGYLLAGSLVQSGFVKIEAAKIGEDTLLSKIIKLVEEAQGSKAPIAKLADKVSLVFVPIVIAISVAAFIIWLLLGESFEFAFRMSVSVLVISCPCALGLATPTAIMVGTGIGAKHGILIKSGEALEKMHKINTVIFDKTGTLTEGRPQVVSIDTMDDKMHFMSLVGSLEQMSEHPLSLAIVEKMKALGARIYKIDNFEAFFGLGVSGRHENTTILIGNKGLMKMHGLSTDDYVDQMDQVSMKGQTPLLVAYDEKIQGIIGIADTLKPSARDGVQLLQQMNIEVVMLTGDNRLTARAIGDSLGINKIIAEVLPDSKGEAVKQLQNEGRYVMMVGDGINDAIALAQAEVGMAIGTGTDIAIESADVVLLQGDIRRIATAMRLSERTLLTIKQNLFWAFIYNILGIPLAAGVLYLSFGLKLNPMIAAAAMSVSSVSVVSNALRLKTFFHLKKTEANHNKGAMKMKKVLIVEGMSCGHCSGRVTQVLSAIEGVSHVAVDLNTKEAVVEMTQDIANAILSEAVVKAGYEVVDIRA